MSDQNEKPTTLEPEMKALETIKKTREYLDYVERHILNVQKAWVEIQVKCQDMASIWDDCRFWSLHEEVKHHDMSKLGKEEFTEYRRHFYPTEAEAKKGHELGMAWEHHKAKNPHHWENWVARDFYHPHAKEMHCLHMVIDWLAMSYEFGDTPRAYYEKNEKRINLPKVWDKMVTDIFDRLENESGQSPT